ncbi:sulfate/molybdate ABC transporter ATP-binding protein [Actinokineospora sp. NPDC004072]
MSIQVRNVHKRFGTFTALDDVSVEVPTGGLTALLGPSGGGKSTLLRVIAGLETPDSGEVLIDGEPATHLPVRKRDVGFVFQHYAAFKHLTVFRNIAFGLEIRRRPAAEVRDRVHELLRLVRLEQFADRLPAQLSGGQRQRMALARALAVEPRVLLLDEPFGALDAQVRTELRDWLRRLHDEVRVTTVFVTHDREEAMEVADEIVVVNQGRVEQTGHPEDLYDHPATDFVMHFLGPTTHLGPTLIRPHDIQIHLDPQPPPTPSSPHPATPPIPTTHPPIPETPTNRRPPTPVASTSPSSSAAASTFPSPTSAASSPPSSSPSSSSSSPLDPAGVPGRVVRVSRVGFEVRVEVECGEQLVQVTLDRTAAAALGLAVGLAVRLSPRSTSDSAARATRPIPARTDVRTPAESYP